MSCSSSYVTVVIFVNFIVGKQFNANGSYLVSPLAKFYNFQLKTAINELSLMNTAQLCEHYGYKSESFTVTTTDGYILTIFRCYKRITKRQPVLLVHGLLDSSDTWSMNPGNKSLVYNYIERGYDVYMLNCRGNRYSKQHITLHPKQSEFWNFSFQEMARYDLPKTIDAIRQRTRSPTLQYVGHSQGGTILIALLSIAPVYNHIISHAGLFAPFTYTSDVGKPVNALYTAFYQKNYQKWFDFLPHTVIQSKLSEKFCTIFDGQLCYSFLNFLVGPSFDQLDADLIPVYASHFPAGASSKQLWHFGQEIHCNYFGAAMNVPYPFCQQPLPRFNLSSITTAFSLFYSSTDPHTHPIDIEMLQKSLSNANLATKEIYNYNHMDFIWGKNADTDVYDGLIARAEQFAYT